MANQEGLASILQWSTGEKGFPHHMSVISKASFIDLEAFPIVIDCRCVLCSQNGEAGNVALYLDGSSHTHTTSIAGAMVAMLSWMF